MPLSTQLNASRWCLHGSHIDVTDLDVELTAKNFDTYLTVIEIGPLSCSLSFVAPLLLSRSLTIGHLLWPVATTSFKHQTWSALPSPGLPRRPLPTPRPLHRPVTASFDRQQGGQRRRRQQGHVPSCPSSPFGHLRPRDKPIGRPPSHLRYFFVFI